MEVLHRTLSLADEVIRHMVLRIPEKVYGPPKAAGASAGSRHRE
jgi:ribosomal protein S6